MNGRLEARRLWAIPDRFSPKGFPFSLAKPVQEVPMGDVKFDFSGFSSFEQIGTAETGATGALKWLGGKLAVNVVTKVLLSIGEGEYRRIVAENDRQRAYGLFIGIMDAVAKQRVGASKPNELSETCPMATTISQFYQTGRTTDGTAPLRMYTVIGADGEVINVQGFDLSQMVKVTVMHKNGMILVEDVSPQDAIKMMRWLAGLRP